jgi:hypothetical protein
MHLPHQNNTLATTNEAPAQGIKMEVGIEDCLHIEFEFDKQKYHLKVLSGLRVVAEAVGWTSWLCAFTALLQHCPSLNLYAYCCVMQQDVILGKIYFLLVRIKIKFMELAVIRREAAGELHFHALALSLSMLRTLCCFALQTVLVILFPSTCFCNSF